MQSFDYIVPIVYVTQDNNTKITKKEIYFKDCSFEDLHPEACSAWGQTKCPADSMYCQPYVKGDIIYNQFAYNPETMSEFQITIINMETGLADESVLITEQSGPDGEKNYFYNFNIDTNYLSDTTSCFQIMMSYTEDGEEKTVYSEPYCVIRCEQKSILVEGTYTNKDCNGHYYGLIDGYASIYRSLFRVRGEVVKVGFDFEETKNVTPSQNYTVKSRTMSRYRVYVEKIPPYVAEQLAQCFGSQNLYIDGVQYEKPSKMSKDFDEGQSWIPLLEVTKACDQIDFTCE
jgi:hypothetical protein